MFFDMPKPKPPIRINRDIRTTPAEHFDYIVEVWFLKKVDENGYFNSVKANLRLKATLWVALIVVLVGSIVTLLAQFALFILYKKEILLGDLTSQKIFAAVLTFFGIWGSLFWREKTHIHKKWEYLAGLYNEVIKIPPAKENEYRSRDVLLVALALDILKMEMWAHESFSELFRSTLEEAICAVAVPKTHGLYIVENLDATGISRADANCFLLRYQQALFEDLDVPAA